MQKKNKILDVCVQAFNNRGYHACTISDLAQACNMSRGNFAYHYKYKKHILNDLVIRMVREVQEIQIKRKNYPAFSNLSLDVKTCGILQDRYQFIFRDMSVLEHTSVQRVMKIWSEISIKRNMEAFLFAIDNGNMKPEPFKGMYYQLAVNAWMVAYYWLAQKSVRTVGKYEQAERMVWSTIMPHFTEKGLNAFHQFYGKTYLERKGAPLESYIKQTAIF